MRLPQRLTWPSSARGRRHCQARRAAAALGHVVAMPVAAMILMAAPSTTHGGEDNAADQPSVDERARRGRDRRAGGGDARAGGGCGRRRPALRDEDESGHDQRLPTRMVQAVRRRGREGFRRPHQGRDLSGEPARLHPASGRGRAVRRDSGLCRAARVHMGGVDERFEGGVGAGSHQGHPARRASVPRPRRAKDDARPRRRQGSSQRRFFHRPAVLGDLARRDPAHCRLQGQEAARAGRGHAARGGEAARRHPGGDDVGRRLAGDSAARHRRRDGRHHRLPPMHGITMPRNMSPRATVCPSSSPTP